MASNGEFIRELHGKLRSLYKSEVAIGIVGHRRVSQEAFARACELSRSSLWGQEKQDIEQNHRLTPELQKALGQKCGFDPAWPEWKTGTVQEFIDRYNREARATKIGSIASEYLSVENLPDVFTHRAALASIGFSGETSEDGSTFDVTLQINCQPDDLGQGVTYIVIKARMLLKLPTSKKDAIKEQLARAVHDCVVRYDAKKQPTLIVGGFGEPPHIGWTFQSYGRPIGRFAPNEPVLKLKPGSVADGAIFDGLLLLYAADLKPIEADQDLQGESFSTSFLLLGKANISRARAAILERLALLPVVEDGWRVAARLKKAVTDGRL